MNAHAFRWQDVRDRREKLFVKCNYCWKYQDSSGLQHAIILRTNNNNYVYFTRNDCLLSRFYREIIAIAWFILLVEPRSKFNKSRGKSRSSACMCVCMCHFLLLGPEIHIIKPVKELAVENATVPPLINEGSQRDRRRHCRGLGLTTLLCRRFLEIRSVSPFSSFSFSHYFFFSRIRTRCTIYPNVSFTLRTRRAPAGWLVSKTRWHGRTVRAAAWLFSWFRFCPTLLRGHNSRAHSTINRNNERKKQRTKEKENFTKSKGIVVCRDKSKWLINSKLVKALRSKLKNCILW